MTRGAWCGGALLFAAVVSSALPGEAVSLTLSESERAEAIRVGERSIINGDFGMEWTVTNGAGETLTVLTPFHRLALAARNAAFRNEPLTPQGVESALKGATGRLVVQAALRGGRPDFARFYASALLGGQSEIKATFAQNERTALREADGRYTARCVYAFPAEGLSSTGRVILVVRAPDAREVARFTMDLASMR